MNIFVAGLSYSINDEELEALFAEYGEISSARVIMDRQTGRSKGYGFVEMDDEEAGERAIKELDGTEFSGRDIAVSVARPREPRRNDFNNRGGGGGGGFRRRDGGY